MLIEHCRDHQSMLTPEQEEAVNFGDGYLHLIACAGSGKTETITRRIARLIADGVPPESIVAFTFTNRAADKMATRVRLFLSELGSDKDNFVRLFVGTIHSYCQQQLVQVAPDKAFDLLDDDDMRPFFCRKHYADLGLDNLIPLYGGERDEWGRRKRIYQYNVIKDFCRNVDLVRDEQIEPDALEPPFRQCYLSYLALLDQYHYLDFAEMIAQYIAVLRGSPALLTAERERVRYLFVDEYQDVNSQQETLIQLMVGEDGNLCVVGDDDQCIYHWRGSNYENIISFGTRYPDATTIKIRENFRSTPGIVTAAAEVIDRNEWRLSKVMKPWPEGKGRTEAGDIAAHFFASEDDEVDAIVEQMRLLRALPYTNNRGDTYALRYSDMAVLMRSVKAPAQSLLTALDRAGVKCVVKGGQLFDRPEIRMVMQAFAYLGGYPYPLGEPTPVTIGDLVDSYTALDWETGEGSTFRSAIIALKKEADRETNLHLQMLFYRVLQIMGARERPFPESWFRNLGKISNLIAGFDQINPDFTLPYVLNFLEYVRGYGWHQVEEADSDERESSEPVTVSTLHGAKGLQFPVVFMPRLNAGEFPYRSRKEKIWFVPDDLPDSLFDPARYLGGLEDDRRLFYVGITRSEKYLYLSGHHSGDGDLSPEDHSIFFDEYPRDSVADYFPIAPTVKVAGPVSAAPPAPPAPLFETSWSELRDYARCPLGHRIKHVYGFQPVMRPEVEGGSAIHAVLAGIHNRAREGDLDVAEIPALMDQYMVLRYASQQGVKREREKLVPQILQYVKDNAAEFERIAGVEQPFRMTVGDAIINGRIDLVLDAGDGGIEIRDFKRTEAGATEARQEIERQLQLYALAAATLPPEVRQGREISKASIYHFDTGTTVEVPVGPAALAAAKEELEGMIAGIRGPGFPSTDDRERCAGCDWGLICCGKPQG